MPTFGKDTDGSGASTSTADKIAVSSASPAETGKVVGASAAMAFSAATNTRFGIYADSAGSPGALLAQADIVQYSGGQITAPVGPWRDFVFSGAEQITVTAGVTYWIGPAWEGGTSTTFGRDGTASLRREGSLSVWPTLTSPTWAAAQTGPVAAYVTYLVPAGPVLRRRRFAALLVR